jgi:riboflavin synthase
MFAGIVTAVGRISKARARGDGVATFASSAGLGMDGRRRRRLDRGAGRMPHGGGEGRDGFEADVSHATLAVTHGLDEGREVNLEKSLRVGDRIDGHLVAGHVDGVGQAIEVEELGGSARI